MQTFDQLELPEQLHKSLKSIGFIEPTQIQKKAIPALISGQDLLACAETGSGKTAAYLIPMLKNLMENPKQSGLILAPTRELAQQIAQFLRSLVEDERKFHTSTLVGGQDIRKQFKSLQKKPRVIVATPGRLIDHLKRNTVQIHKIETLVLDEGDRMIDMGFEPQLKQILEYLPEERQTSFFTATMDKKVQALTSKYLSNPAQLMINNSRPVSTIRQTVIKVTQQDKMETVLDQINARQGSIVIFFKTRRGTDKLYKFLNEYGVSVDLIHGGKTQGQRNKAIQNFKKGTVRVLCATDVAARGIDVPQVEHVINYDLPMQDEDYVHRVGRTARNGADGEAISFVTPSEHDDWNRLVKMYGIPDAMLEPGRGQRKKVSKGQGRQKRFSRKSGESSTPRKKFSGFGKRKSSDESAENPRPSGKKNKKVSFTRTETENPRDRKKKKSFKRSDSVSEGRGKKKKSFKKADGNKPFRPGKNKSTKKTGRPASARGGKKFSSKKSSGRSAARRAW